MSIISTITDIAGSDKTRAGAFLSELDPDDDSTVLSGSTRQFQYYPETISDSRGVEYQSKNIVGSSHPIYQWVHGSERRIGFEAVFTSDYSTVTVNNTDENTDTLLDLAQGVSAVIKNPLSAVASLVSAFTGGNLDPNPENDVAAAVAWLRSKTYPLYRTNRPVIAPPKLLLWLQNSGITSFVGDYTVDVIPVLMTRCDVTYDAFFRNGRPRIATVSLDFFETIQVGDSWGYVSRADIEPVWTKNYKFKSKDGRDPSGNQVRNEGSALKP